MEWIIIHINTYGGCIVIQPDMFSCSNSGIANAKLMWNRAQKLQTALVKS